jgi:hypothetical protein
MRTTPDQVIAMGKMPEGTDVVPYIEIATNIVDDLAKCDKSLDSTKLELIERCLACHYAYTSGVSTGASITSKSIGGASTSFSRPTGGTGLQGSPYGLTALQLDKKRCLVGILDGQVSITWLGTSR